MGRNGPKVGGAVRLSVGGARSHRIHVLSPGLWPTSIPSGILIHPPVRPLVGAAVPCFWRGELGPHVTQCCLGRGLLPNQVASSSIQLFGGAGFPSNTMSPGPWLTSISSGILIHPVVRPLVGGCCAPFLEGGAGSPCNTMLSGPRPTSVPSGIIHPAVWPQQTWAEN